MTSILRFPRRVALAVIAALIAGASLVSFAESYRGLYLWAHHHGLPGPWAVIWPVQVDVFIAVGELALFVALADRWDPRSRTAAWTVTIIGLGVSVAGNVGHVAGDSMTARATAAVPPLAAASALAVGLGVLKRVVERHHLAAEANRMEGAPGALWQAAPDDPGFTTQATSAPAPGVIPEVAFGVTPHQALEAAPGAARKRAPSRSPAAPAKQPPPATPERLAEFYAGDLAAGKVPSARRIKKDWPVGSARSAELHDHLAAALTPP